MKSLNEHNILGVHCGHNATVTLVKDGKLIFAMSEERLNRLKNSNGAPVQVLDYVYKNYIKPEDVDLAILSQEDITGYVESKSHKFISWRDFSSGNVNFKRSYSLKKHILSRMPGYFYARSLLGKIRHWYRVKKLSDESSQYYAKILKLPKEKIKKLNHHSAHAYAACFNLDPNKKTLILTMDGEGDGLSSTVNIYKNYSLEKISQNPTNVSLGYFFTQITKLLGMIPNEHEFKVMGLAPYAKQDRARKLYEQFKDIVILNDRLEFESKLPMHRSEYYFLEQFYGQRFDTIAAFAQIFLEEKVFEWVKGWIKKPGFGTWL